MKQYYYVDKAGTRQGPLPLEDINAQDISPTTLVWCKGMEKWMKACEVDDFQALLQEEAELPTSDDSLTDSPQESGRYFSATAERFGIVIDKETSDFIDANKDSVLVVTKYIKEKYDIGLKEAKDIADEIVRGDETTQNETSYSASAYEPETYSSEAPYPVADEDAHILIKIICFFFPIVGLVLFFVKKGDNPKYAKSCIIWGAIGFAFQILMIWL